MDLIATPKNPIPLGAASGFLEVRKGVRIRYARWPSLLRERRGTVCIFPGRAEFIEKYFEVVGELRRRGFAVAILDWRGQGGSSRLTRNAFAGHVRDFTDYEDDVSLFMREVVLPDCPAPYFALAHSMAGTILFGAATHRSCWFNRIVMTAPMLKITGLPMSASATGQLADLLSFFGLGRSPVPGGTKRNTLLQRFENNPLTSDHERFMRNQSVLNAAPQLAIGPPTIGWLRAALAAIADITSEQFPNRLRVPVLMFAAGDDAIVDPRAIEDLASYLKIGSQIVMRGSRHEILQERDAIRQQFWAAFDAFIPGATISLAS